MQDIYVIVLVQNHVIRLAGRYNIFPTKMEFAISNSSKYAIGWQATVYEIRNATVYKLFQILSAFNVKFEYFECTLEAKH
jgi:hypothetical protein